jgi:hypothetical protein
MLMASVWGWYPPVGVFIGILAFLGVLVPLLRDLGKIGKLERAFWTFVMFALVLLEIRSIYLDRDAHDKEQAAARAEQLRQFEAIAQRIDTSIAASQKQFDATMFGIKENIYTITGGKSFCYLMFADNGTLPTFVHSGDYPLADVSARIVDMQKWNQMVANNPHPSMQEFLSSDINIQLGNLPVHTALPRAPIQLAGQTQSSFNIFYSARNGFWTQELRLRLIDGKWLTATRVTRMEIGTKDKTPKKLFGRIDKGFPRNSNGEVDWQ